MGIQPEVIEPKRRVSPVLVVVLAVAAVAALVFGVILPLFGGEEEETSPPAARRPATTATTPAPTAPAAQPPAETFEQFGAKDPFRPLVVEGAPPAAPGAPAPAPAPAGAGAAGAPAPSGGQQVQLLDIFEEGGTTKAQIRVGSTVYTVAPGTVFATNFKLVSISGNCATLLHGDDKFTLCEGEEVFK